MSSAQREYDPEIKDIADYVANKPIDSDLAVSTLNPHDVFFCTLFFPVVGWESSMAAETQITPRLRPQARGKIEASNTMDIKYRRREGMHWISVY